MVAAAGAPDDAKPDDVIVTTFATLENGKRLDAWRPGLKAFAGAGRGAGGPAGGAAASGHRQTNARLHFRHRVVGSPCRPVLLRRCRREAPRVESPGYAG